MLSDPIADMLTRIRNALKVQKLTVELPFSKFKFELAKILQREGYLEAVNKKGKKIKKLELVLKYEGGLPVISEIKRVSKPGRRIYVSAKDIKPVKQGYGLAVISTSQGLLTDKEAKKQKIGGEVICEIW